MKSGLKFQDWRSQRFSLFGSLIETLEKKLDKEKAKVSQLMTEKGAFSLSEKGQLVITSLIQREMCFQRMLMEQ